MPVCWRCPGCQEDTCHTDYIDPREPVSCARCEAVFDRDEVLCVVCDSRSPLSRTDTIHYLCLVCGNRQTLWSESA